MRKLGLEYQLLCSILVMIFMTGSLGYEAQHGDFVGAVLSAVIAITTGAVAFCILEAIFDGWVER